MSFSFVSLFLIGLMACGGAQQEQYAQRAKAAGETPAFQFSTALPPKNRQPANNWCYARYGENIVVNAENLNTNRRFFYLPSGITKLVAGPDGATATLLLYPKADGNVEVFTGANFPECLSNPGNIDHILGDPSFVYDNRSTIHFSVDLLLENGHPKITVELPVGANYAMSVERCQNCQ